MSNTCTIDEPLFFIDEYVANGLSVAMPTGTPMKHSTTGPTSRPTVLSPMPNYTSA